MEYSKENYVGVGHVPIGIGAQIHGWAIEEDRYRDPNKLPIVDFLAMTHKCPHNCECCFPKEDGENTNVKTLTFEEIAGVIDQLAEIGTCGINYVGEGEPTIDEDFFRILDYTASKGIKAMVFTDAATRLTDRDFVRRLKQTGASVGPKCDSLWNPVYQNWVVRSGEEGMPGYNNLTETQKLELCKDNFFNRRNEAIKVLMEEGFNEVSPDGTTRMGFDMVVTKANVDEIPKTLRFCRDNNLWIVFSFYIPAGGSASPDFDNSLAFSVDEEEQIMKMVQQIDRDEYNYVHDVYRNFGTHGCPELMQIRGNGDVTTCPGDVEVIGNIKNYTVAECKRIIETRSPHRMTKYFNLQCNRRKPFNKSSKNEGTQTPESQSPTSIIAEQREFMPIRSIEDIETCPVGCKGCKRC